VAAAAGRADHHTPTLVALAVLFGADAFAAQSWRGRASCRGEDPSRWFPARGADLSELRTVCHGCPVRAECLAYALGGGASSTGGIWAGTSARQRREIRRRGWSVDRALEWLDARGW
jgi:WhiB family transcriptional regulator, redox-sensing transcriptional regulator